MRKTVLCKYFVVLCQHVKNNCMVSELEKHWSRERTKQTTVKHDFESGVLRKTTIIDDKFKRPVVRLAPSSMKVFFGRKKGQRCWRQSSASRESLENLDENLKKCRSS